jgi:hypothetical protein
MAEGIGRGLKAALTALFIGLVLSALLSTLGASMMGESGKSITVLINFASMLWGIVQFERAKYWGLMYSLGYFVGLFFIGKYLMEPLEQFAYLAILGVYIIQKFLRKVNRKKVVRF